MSFRPSQSLPDEVIERLFTVLAVRYGAPFLERWRDLELDAVKGDWARQLGGFANNLEAIRFALDNLPEKPPTVLDFRKLCNAAPPPSDPHALVYNSGPVRAPTDAERQALRGLAADIRAGQAFAKPGRAWAEELLACHEAGWRNGQPFASTPAAIAMAREVAGGAR